METNNIASIPVDTLKNRIKLASLAIFILIIGALTSLIAIAYRYFKSDVFEATTFVVTLIALLLVIPVMINRKRLIKALESRV